MAENVWSLLDGRSINVQFDAAQAEGVWSLNDGRSFDVAFSTPTTPWAEWDWLCGGGMIQAADGGGPVINGSAGITLEDVVSTSTASLSINALASITLEDTTTASSASLALDGSASVPLDDLVCAATGSLSINAQADITLDDAICTSTATISSESPGGGEVWFSPRPKKKPTTINADAFIVLEDTVCTAQIKHFRRPDSVRRNEESWLLAA